jgi:hypothetical protein
VLATLASTPMLAYSLSLRWAKFGSLPAVTMALFSMLQPHRNRPKPEHGLALFLNYRRWKGETQEQCIPWKFKISEVWGTFQPDRQRIVIGRGEPVFPAALGRRLTKAIVNGMNQRTASTRPSTFQIAPQNICRVFAVPLNSVVRGCAILSKDLEIAYFGKPNMPQEARSVYLSKPPLA